MKLTFNNNKASILRGEVCPLLIECEGVKDFHQVQIEIISAGTKNPGGALGFGTVANPISDDIYEVEVQTQALALGLYEIALVRFHTKLNGSHEKVDLVKEVAFDRIIFSINSVFDTELSQDQVATVCISREQVLEVEFNSGIELPHNNGAQKFSCFVFVKYLLLGRRTRFNKFEVLPYGRGLDSKDHLELINEFFKHRTETGLKFNYSDDAMRLSRQQQPVSIIHFPNVIASDTDAVQKYCEEQTNLLLNVLALTRGSKGEAFDIIVCNREKPDAAMFSLTRPYRGNLLTGQMSGEHASTLETYISALQTNPFKNFLLNLYKEAIAENSQDFQFLRLWQILELVADRKNYDPASDLLDDKGEVIFKNGAALKLKDSVPSVYAVLRDNTIDTANAWENVNIWFGFRTAVAHHGLVENYQSLARADVKAWVKAGLAKIEEAGGHNTVLSGLKSAVDLLLRKILIETNHA